MGKGLLIMVAAISLIGGSLLYNGTNQVSSANNDRIADYASNLIAREIAYTGMGDAILRIDSELKATGSYTGPLNWSHTYQGGIYSVDVSMSADSLVVSSKGMQDSVEYVILREYAVNTSPGGGGPAFMSAGITSDGNIEIQNTLTLQAANPGQNADLHANDNINISGGTVLIEGFGYRVGNTTITNGQSATSVFQPNDNPGGLPVTQVVSGVNIPAVNASGLASHATNTHSGNFSISGLMTLGTRQNPKIWFIDGNLKTTADVIFDGYGVFLVTGNVDIFHDVAMVGTSVESTLGFYVDDNIRLNAGHLHVAGQWYANGNITLEDQTVFTGTLTTLDNFESTGHVLINYKPSSSALTAPLGIGSGGSSTGSLTMLSTREWSVLP